MVDLRLLQHPQPVVRRGVQVEHPAVALDGVDGRQELLALQPVPVQLRGRQVGGGHQGDAAAEQQAQQTAQDHGVGDVGDEELVEAQHPRARRHVRGDPVQRVLQAPVTLQRLVHPPHHAVEVDAQLVLEGQFLEEQVHEQGLAAAHAAPEIESAHRLHREASGETAGEAAAKRRAGAGVGDQFVVQALQLRNCGLLGRVAGQILPAHAFQVTVADGHGATEPTPSGRRPPQGFDRRRLRTGC